MPPVTRSKVRREVVYLPVDELLKQHRAKQERVKNLSFWAQASRPTNLDEDKMEIQFRIVREDQTVVTEKMTLADAKVLGGDIATCSDYIDKALGPGYGISLDHYHLEAFQLFAAISVMGSANIILLPKTTPLTTTQLLEAALVAHKNGTPETIQLVIEHLHSKRNEIKLFQRNDLIMLFDPEGPFRQLDELRDLAVRWWAADVHEAQIEQWAIWSPELVAQGRRFMFGTLRTRAAKMEALLGDGKRTPPASTEEVGPH
ncbi:hypothetical protein KVT40_001160 [Elsinoe batatas]|uniref:Uncharacterized protein n=1 Tax=Elsinoe batatas TaxID=2601811 RepID=A0A8K0LDD6_9PEZI|nr:hypothetical protein KVT40_001160 [Elsinoe batatas]